MKSGVPLFYLPPNESALINASSDFGYPQFDAFWRPICVLDLGYWQRWLHSHRISILLQHDRPIPKHLHLPSASGRYHTIQCRQVIYYSLWLILHDFYYDLLIENYYILKGFDGFERRIAGFHKLRPLRKSFVHRATQERLQWKATVFLLLDSSDSQASLSPNPNCLSWRNCWLYSPKSNVLAFSLTLKSRK